MTIQAHVYNVSILLSLCYVLNLRFKMHVYVTMKRGLFIFVILKHWVYCCDKLLERFDKNTPLAYSYK